MISCFTASCNVESYTIGVNCRPDDNTYALANVIADMHDLNAVRKPSLSFNFCIHLKKSSNTCQN
eukprot:3144897-Ditylum_brightwellii.AAC.1